jgi:hypothetical protein
MDRETKSPIVALVPSCSRSRCLRPPRRRRSPNGPRGPDTPAGPPRGSQPTTCPRIEAEWFECRVARHGDGPRQRGAPRARDPFPFANQRTRPKTGLAQVVVCHQSPPRLHPDPCSAGAGRRLCSPSGHRPCRAGAIKRGGVGVSASHPRPPPPTPPLISAHQI